MAKPSSRHTIYKGKLLNVLLEERTLPNFKRAKLEYIRHPGSVAIVPFLDANHILLIRQYRPVINKYIWEIPAGTQERGERPIDCARRELIEETGYRAARLIRLGSFYTTPGFCTERMAIYAAYGLSRAATNEEEDEIIYRKSFSIVEARKMLRKNQIQDAKTLVGLFNVLWKDKKEDSRD